MNIINMFTTEDNLTLVRDNASPTKVKGTFVDAATTSTSFTGSIQPMDREDLENLTEGQKSRDPRIIYTETLLRTVDKKNKLGADTVNWNGYNYEVIAVENLIEWDGGDLAHYAVSIIRKDQ